MSEQQQRERADRLARAYIIMCGYSFGPKRSNLFPLVMDAHQSVSVEDLAPVKEAVWAEIEPFPDYEEPKDDEDEWS